MERLILSESPSAEAIEMDVLFVGAGPAGLAGAIELAKLVKADGTIGDVNIGVLEKAGALIDAAVEAGANQVNGPTMSVADQSSLYRQALKAAMADARLSAETLAAAAGRSLGKVTTVVESSGSAPVPMFAKAAAADSATPIEAGTQETTAQVTVTFALG